MSDETRTAESATTPEPEPPAAPGPSTGEAWDAVLARMSDFGVAVSVWAGAAANEPETKERLDEVRAGIDEIGTKLDAAVGRAVRSQAGQAIGDAARTVAEATAPTVRDVFSELSNMFGRAASRVDATVKAAAADSAPVEEPASPPSSPESEPSGPDGPAL